MALRKVQKTIHVTLLVIAMCLAKASAASPLGETESFVRGRVILLTSVETTKGTLQDKLERDFKAAMQNSGYELIIRRNADAEDLSYALTDNRTTGVFWVSHAGVGQSGGGLLSGDSIRDVNLADVKDVFQRIHPNVRWVSVVGCNAAKIIEDLRKKSYFQSNPNLVIQSFDDVTDANWGLIYALNRSVKVLGDPQKSRNYEYYGNDERFASFDIPKIVGRNELLLRSSKQRPVPMISVSQIWIELPKSSVTESPTQVFLNGVFLGVIPKNASEGIYRFGVPMSKMLDSDRRFTLKLTNGKGLYRPNASLPEGVSISMDGLIGEWELFRTPSGAPAGVNSVVYYFKE